MHIQRHADVTPAVLEVMERTRDPRLREIMLSLIKHLHGFVREARLTEAEFREAAAVVAMLIVCEDAFGQTGDSKSPETISVEEYV